MEFNEFAEKVRSSAQEILGDDFYVELKEIIKINGIRMTNVTIYNKNTSVAPSIYLEDFYEQYVSGKSFDGVMNKIMKVYWEYKPEENLDLSYINEYELVKSKLVISLVNHEKNIEFTKDCPTIPFLDLDIIFNIELNNSLGNGLIKITDKMMATWEINSQTLLEDAMFFTMHNHKEKCFTMFEYFISAPAGKELISCEELDYRSYEFLKQTWIVTNEDGYRGAAVMLYEGMMSKFADVFESSYYIIPSSIHELILIPDKECASYDCLPDLECIKSMVKMVNSTEVSPNEVLSDNVYYFDRYEGKVLLA